MSATFNISSPFAQVLLWATLSFFCFTHLPLVVLHKDDQSQNLWNRFTKSPRWSSTVSDLDVPH
ncbi:hypothetical protein PHET_06320 [Paragonimus heterotremus]|uniref:Uncharacterized protein n=1 Tax=Paragonimus heterotremus TaxID=100268 RepID=A0A8J4WQY1_9TREM|nr:hypothetical protein PHET_06320 [Paragonimus heterotremus]